MVLHQSRLLVPQDRGPVPIELDREYSFDLDDPDLVDLAIVPDFPCSREDAIELAKRQRVEVRILVVGLRMAHLRSRGAGLRPVRHRAVFRPSCRSRTPPRPITESLWVPSSVRRTVRRWWTSISGPVSARPGWM